MSRPYSARTNPTGEAVGDKTLHLPCDHVWHTALSRPAFATHRRTQHWLQGEVKTVAMATLRHHKRQLRDGKDIGMWQNFTNQEA